MWTEYSRAKLSIQAELWNQWWDFLKTKLTLDRNNGKFAIHLLHNRKCSSCRFFPLFSVFPRNFDRRWLKVKILNRKISRSESVVKRVNSNVVILTCFQAATWKFSLVQLVSAQHKMTTCIHHIRGNWGIKWRKDIAIDNRQITLAYIFTCTWSSVPFITTKFRAETSWDQGITSVEWLWYLWLFNSKLKNKRRPGAGRVHERLRGEAATIGRISAITWRQGKRDEEEWEEEISSLQCTGGLK